MNSRLSAILILLLAAVFGLGPAAAQNCTVSGVVSDSATGDPVADAIVAFKGGSAAMTCKSDSAGFYTLVLPRGGGGKLVVDCEGYKQFTRIVNCSKSRVTQDIELVSRNINLKEVVVKSQTPLMTQRGDTTVYNASAYKVNIDASAYDLISQKLPGVGLRDGKLEAHGEEVKEIKIDGREYFKSDINMALKNLPANVVSKIQVYDQLSDYSQLTGFDDGNTQKVINIQTTEGMDRSMFGKMYGGAGLPDKYKAYGMFNSFNDDRRISLFAQFNNINEQNFSMLDLLASTGSASTSAPTQSPFSKGASDNSFHPTASDDVSSMMVDVSEYGVTTTMAAGTNYSDHWHRDKMKFSGHYLFNNSSNDATYNIFDAYYGNTASDNLQEQKVKTDNMNHRANVKWEYQIDPSNYVMFRPAVSCQKKREHSYLTDWTVAPADTALLLNQNTVTDQWVVSSSAEAMVMHKFGNSGHVLSGDARVSYIHTSENIGMDFSNVQTDDNAIQSGRVKNSQERYSYMLSYVFPVNRDSRLKLDAGWMKSYGTVRRKTEIKANGREEFQLDSLLTGSTWARYGGPVCTLSYMFSNKHVNLVAGAELQVFNFYRRNDKYYNNSNYIKVLPFAFLRYRVRNGQLHFQYKMSHLYPGLLQIHDAINNSNAILAIRGNLLLEPALQNSITLRWVMRLPSNNSVFVFFNNIEQIDNYIGTMRSLASESYLEEGERRNTEMMTYQNTDGYFAWASLVAYGQPISFLSSNLNLSTQVRYSKIPGFWDNNRQVTSQWNWSGSVTLGSNISKDIDFVVDVNAKYNTSRNLNFADMKVRYWSLSYGAQLNWQFIPQMKIVLEGGHTNYFGSGTAQYNALISNFAIAYKFMRHRAAELRFSIHDIFNQDNNFLQTNTELYRREVTTNILGRYVMLTFTYNLNHLKSRSK